MDDLQNWKTQIRKGYLELCILLLLKKHKRAYGFDLLEKLRQVDLDLKEGTLYPLLNRMTTDGVLKSAWETENIKGHPRKFYSLTKNGTVQVNEMSEVFDQMIAIYKTVKE